MKTRTPRLTNPQLLTALGNKGYIAYDIKTKLPRLVNAKTINSSTGTPSYWRNWWIPKAIYEEATGKKFGSKYNIGDMIRVRQRSTRRRPRNSWATDVGDRSVWGAYGIGTGIKWGKSLVKKFEQEGNNTFSVKKVWGQLCIGNVIYANPIYANKMYNFYKNRGIEVLEFNKKVHYWTGIKVRLSIDYLADTITIRPYGLIGNSPGGPKKLVNGWVKSVYVYFIQNRWKSKREARYEVVFENGASAIITDDYMERVYDTDYDWESEAYACPSQVGLFALVDEEDQNFFCGQFCSHKKLHKHKSSCERDCDNMFNVPKELHLENKCAMIYSYEDMFEQTWGLGELTNEKGL